MDSWLKTLETKEIKVIGFPCNFGQRKKGVEEGPKAMRDHGSIKEISEMGYLVQDLGDLDLTNHGSEISHNVRNSKSVGEANKKLADKVEEVLKAGSFCVALGGDHCMAIGSIVGHCRAETNLGIIWVDAHADINPPLLSKSGNSHGMPLSFLVHELSHLIPKDVQGMEWIRPCIHAKDIAYIGLRDVDDAEKQILKRHSIKAFFMSDVTKMGISRVAEEAINHVSPSLEKPIHISFDIDSLDPLHAASTGTPVPGGLLLREGVFIVESVAATGKLQVIDIAEVNPKIGSEEDRLHTLDSASEIIGACFGKRARERINPDFRMQ